MNSSSSAPPVVPVFAVVGRVNRGKSSIIATLAEEDSIAISPLPGTTRRCTSYDVELHGTVLFRLVDTPGFEEAARALAWLKQGEPSAAQRKARVRAFRDTFSNSPDFVEECELLTPILQGAAILYVVDGSTPFRENIMAEVEVLRWTGQPRMALVNRSASGDYVSVWHDALAPAFSVVRNFDAHAASFRERLRLLSLFCELVDEWHSPLSQAIELLKQEHERRLEQSAEEIAALLVACASHTVTVRGAPNGLDDRERKAVEGEFLDALRKREAEEQRAVERLYRHHRLNAKHDAELERPLFQRDLFSERVWSSLGLTGKQLVATYSLAGATAGGTIDAMVGGASLMAGAVIGAAVGGAAALWQLGDRALSVVAVDGIVDRVNASGRKSVEYRVGPHQHLNFPFVLLDRALLHHRAVRFRAHALNASTELTVPKDDGPTRGLVASERQQLSKLFSKLRKSPDADPAATRQALSAHVLRLLRRQEQAQ